MFIVSTERLHNARRNVKIRKCYDVTQCNVICKPENLLSLCRRWLLPRLLGESRIVWADTESRTHSFSYNFKKHFYANSLPLEWSCYCWRLMGTRQRDFIAKHLGLKNAYYMWLFWWSMILWILVSNNTEVLLAFYCIMQICIHGECVVELIGHWTAVNLILSTERTKSLSNIATCWFSVAILTDRTDGTDI